MTDSDRRRYSAWESRRALAMDALATLVIVALCAGVVVGYLVRAWYG